MRNTDRHDGKIPSLSSSTLIYFPALKISILLICIACLASLVVFSLAHAVKTNYWAADDEVWIDFASKGPKNAWTSASPFYHYRPIVGTWFAFLLSVGLSSPALLAVAGMFLVLVSGFLGYHLFRFWLDKLAAIIAASLFIIHPIRQAHIFWISAQIDSWCLVLSLATLIFALQLRKKKGKILLQGIFLTILTASACLSKEIGLLLPLLIFILPGDSLPYRRFVGAVFSLFGAGMAFTLTFFILNGPGRSELIISRLNLLRLRYYPSHLLWPTDLASTRMKALVYNQYFEIILYVISILILALVLGWICLRSYKQKWVHAALILIGAGAAICCFDSAHRGLGLGCAGMVVLLSGTLSYYSSKLPAWSVLAGLLVIVFAWSPCWHQTEKAWTEAKNISKNLNRDYRELRRIYGQEKLLVLLGGVLEIKGIAWPVDMTLLDHNLCSLLWLKCPLPAGRMEIKEKATGRYSFSTSGLTRFIRTCEPYIAAGILEVLCLHNRYAVSVEYDTAQFHFWRPHQGDPLFIYWDGSHIRLLSEK